MKASHYLITGGAGFIGSHLVARLLQEPGVEITVLDDLSSGSRSNLPDHPSLHFMQASVTDNTALDKIFTNNTFDAVIHLAAIASVQECLHHPLASHQVNTVSTLQLLEKARSQNPTPRFIFASSAAVYGDEPSLPKMESSPVKPISPYGVDKYSSERHVLNYSHLFGLDTYAFRFFNVYGPRQNPASPYSGVLSIFLDQYMKNDIPRIRIYGDGLQTRDFVYVEDVIQAIYLAILGKLESGQVYNVATGTESSLKDIIDILSEMTGKQPRVEFLPERSGDIRYSRADITLLKSFSYFPKFTIKQGLSSYLNYF